jgi:hypothetical protein
MPRKNHDLVTRLVPAILLAVLLQIHPAVAEVRVAGQPDAVSVEVRDAAVEEVLVALGQSFGLQYRSAAPLARRISGTYKGPLSRVLRRVLDGYDFILKTGSENLEVVVIGAPAADGQPTAAVASPLPAVPALTPPRPPDSALRPRRRHN